MNFKKVLPPSVKNKYRGAYDVLQLNIKIVCGKLVRYFRRPSFPINIDGTINLHLGCGSINHPSFINIDGIPAPHIHYVGRIDKLTYIKDNSVDLIYACHCLEHFSHRQIPLILIEWYRIIKKGGILRISVPDFDLLVDLYLATGRDLSAVLESVTGGQDHKYNYHLTIFNEAFLRSIARHAGFVIVRAWTPGSSQMTTFDDWSGRPLLIDDNEFAISLNLEMVK